MGLTYETSWARYCYEKKEWLKMTPERQQAADDECNPWAGLVLWFCCLLVLLPLLICSLTNSCSVPPTPTPAPPVFNMTTGMTGGGNSSTPVPTPPPGPFCCTEDRLVGVNSTYVSASPTLCGDYDYNCDGVNTTYACCHSVEPAENAYDERIVYERAACAVASGGEPLSNDPDSLCGACQATTVYPGWACNVPVVTKRFVLPCPASCGELVVVTQSTPPDIGECALFTDHCVPPHGGDGEQCCLVAVN